MAAFTSATTGVWSHVDQWGGAGFPGDGDTFTIQNAHTITADGAITVGDSPNPIATIGTINGILVIPTSTSLKFRGRVILSSTTAGKGRIQMSGGGIELDDNGTGVQYTLRIGAENTSTARIELVSGTSSITSTNHSVPGFLIGGGTNTRCGLFIGTGALTASYLGDSSNPWLVYWIDNNSAAQLIVRNWTVDNCGKLFNSVSYGAQGVIDIDGYKATNTLGTLSIENSAGGSPTGARSWLAVNLDKRWKMNGADGFIIGSVAKPTYLHQTTDWGGGAWTSFTGIYRLHITGNLGGPMSDSLILWDVGGSNPHGFGLGSTNYTMTDTWWAPNTATADNGDWIVAWAGDQGSARSISLLRVVFLPFEDGKSAALTYPGFNNTALSVNHCTIYVTGANGGVDFGETGGGVTGGVPFCKNSIFHGPGGNPGNKMHEDATIDTADVVTVADYNNGHNMRTATGSPPYNVGSGAGYESRTATGDGYLASPGANDIDEDPGFGDPTFLLSSWDADLGGGGTYAGAITRLQADPTLWESSLRPALEDAWAPSNGNLEDAGDDAVTIGALELAAAAEGSNLPFLQAIGEA